MQEYWPEKRLVQNEWKKAKSRNALQFIGTTALIGILGLSGCQFYEKKLEASINAPGVVQAVKADYAFQAMRVAVEMDDELKNSTREQLSDLEKRADKLKQTPEFKRYVTLKESENLVKYGILGAAFLGAYLAFVHTGINGLKIQEYYQERLRSLE
ncbi:MAG TPA: hypothetical protein VHA12_02570 [Candidatus Nanoarchaeia archaeon]|nr:hypothetical protein [Candidatus Nanoarchaeia archaeon]